MTEIGAAQTPAQQPDTDEHLDAVRQQLLAQFASTVGDAAVVRAVTMAVQAVQFFGDDPEARGGLVERIARNELQLLQEGRNERAWT